MGKIITKAVGGKKGVNVSILKNYRKSDKKKKLKNEKIKKTREGRLYLKVQVRKRQMVILEELQRKI